MQAAQEDRVRVGGVRGGVKRPECVCGAERPDWSGVQFATRTAFISAYPALLVSRRALHTKGPNALVHLHVCVCMDVRFQQAAADDGEAPYTRTHGCAPTGDVPQGDARDFHQRRLRPFRGRD